MTGQIIASLASSHEGFLLCNGQSVAKADYPQLYALLGNTYGSTSTHFTLPDLADKALFGASGNHAVKSDGGSNTITLSNVPKYSGTAEESNPVGCSSIATNQNNAMYSYDVSDVADFFPKNIRVNYFIAY